MEEIRSVPLYPNFRATSGGKILGIHGEEIGCFKGKYVNVSTRNGRPYKPFDIGAKSTSVGRAVLILLAFKGLPPPVLLNPEVDHINRNKHDDRPENLRWADRYDQMQNRDVKKNSASQIKGLTERHHWQCQVKHLGKEYNRCFPFAEKDKAIVWLIEKRRQLGIPDTE
jgi:hypothetical protein